MLPNLNQDTLEIYWESVVDTMAEGLLIVDTDGIVRFMNPAAEEITGYKREEAQGHPCTVFGSDTCMACKDSHGKHNCALFEQGTVQKKKCTLRRKDGALIYLLKNAVLLHDVTGQVIGGVETITDITDTVDKDRQINGLRRELARSYGFEGMMGGSQVMVRAFEMLEAAAASSAPVVLLGESGTGKELAAAAIHRRSTRRQGPFIKVNCAALNESILESELFGHEKGAFTGAYSTRQGRFEAANGGSILLDEIGDMPPSVQVKLLRVLQEGEIERVGSHQTIKVDVRIITATNQDLADLVARGLFRSDLYYRINVIPIALPPLRDRRPDIPLLSNTFVERAALRSDRPISGFSPEAMNLLMSHSWPGNVRELMNVVEFSFVTCREGMIEAHHLPPDLQVSQPLRSLAKNGQAQTNQKEEELRREIQRALALSGGRKAQAAHSLGISRVTLWKRMKRLGLEG